jgi:hypothetical protein
LAPSIQPALLPTLGRTFRPILLKIWPLKKKPGPLPSNFHFLKGIGLSLSSATFRHFVQNSSKFGN